MEVPLKHTGVTIYNRVSILLAHLLKREIALLHDVHGKVYVRHVRRIWFEHHHEPGWGDFAYVVRFKTTAVYELEAGGHIEGIKGISSWSWLESSLDT